MRLPLTERSTKAATAEGRRSPIFYDDEVIGFGLQVRDNGRKTFTLDSTFESRRRRTFIADHTGWSTASARPNRPAFVLLVALAAAVLGSAYGVWQAIRLSPLEAMKHD